ncbi:MAG: MoaD/ThiS family protein [Candidatus Bathyarchaeia archaeon]
MIRVKLVFLDEDLRKIVNVKEAVFELSENSTVEELLFAAALKYSEKILDFLSKEGIIIMLNGQNIEFLEGVKTKLSDEDRVAIVPPVNGG